MDLMTLLASIPGIGKYLPYLVALGAVCATIATLLPAPKPDSNRAYVLVYTAINWLGLNFGHARNAGAPVDAPKPPAGTVSAIVALILTGGLLAGCSAQQSQQATQIASAAAQIEVAAGKPDLPTLQKACDAFNVTAAASQTVVQGGAKTTEGYVAAPGMAFCSIVQGGAVPVNADANSTNWLGVLQTTIETVKALAPLAVAFL